MVLSMMLAAEREQVAGVGRASVQPMHDVVHLDEPSRGAPWHPTTAVAAFDDPSCAIGDDPLRTTDGERKAVTFPHGLHGAVAQQPVTNRHRHVPSVGRGGRTIRHVDVQPGAVAIATRLRRNGGE